jgi:signal transduction histidine kinase
MNSTNRTLWILCTGFVLVILMLTLLAWLGFRQAASIREKASALVNEHRFTAYLVDDLELERHRASTLLLSLSRSRLPLTDDTTEKLRGTLREFEMAIPVIAGDGERLMPHPDWANLRDATRTYSAELQSALMKPSHNEAALLVLQQRYDEFVHATDQVLKLDVLRAADAESRIEEESRNLTTETGGLLFSALLLSLACAFGTIRFTVLSLRRIEWQAQELNRVSWHLIQGQEEAARRFSHEMHDELGQSLTGLKAMLSAVQPTTFATRRKDCLQSLDEAISNVRELSQLLRPVILDDFGLTAALRWLAERFQERTRILVTVETTCTARLDEAIETHLFRISQEALTNIARHSMASRAHIRLEEDGAEISLTITDNGIGIPNPPQKMLSLGLVGMRARAIQLGGTFELKNNPSGGVCVAARVPTRWAAEGQSR